MSCAGAMPAPATDTKIRGTGFDADGVRGHHGRIIGYGYRSLKQICDVANERVRGACCRIWPRGFHETWGLVDQLGMLAFVSARPGDGAMAPGVCASRRPAIARNRWPASAGMGGPIRRKTHVDLNSTANSRFYKPGLRSEILGIGDYERLGQAHRRR